MNAPFKHAIAILSIALSICCNAQDTVRVNHKDWRSNIVIVAKDFSAIEGKVIDIKLDYIVLDAAPYNTPLQLTKYFIRPINDYYRIDVEYIQAAILKVKKKMGRSVVNGAISGGSTASMIAENTTSTVGEYGAATAAGIVIGSITGVAKGMGRKRMTIAINGSAENLVSLLPFYQ